MVIQWIIFAGLAVVAVASAMGMLLSKNAIYAALNLIINFVTVAAFYLVLSAPFISLAQVTVYAGAIMVLFLFVIMLLGAEHLGSMDIMPWQKPLAAVLGIILLLEIGYILVTRSSSFTQGSQVADNFGAPQFVGEMLFSKYLLPFEVISIVLLVAIIGAIVLTRRHNKPL